MTAYQVELAPAAARQLSKLSRDVRVVAASALAALAWNPRPPGCVKLSGSKDLWRLRFGSYRVVYQIADDRKVITVVKIGHRKEIYR